MEKINQTQTKNKKVEEGQLSQFPTKLVSGLTKYVSKKQAIAVGALFSLIVILLIVAAVTKKLPQQRGVELSENGFEEVSQSTVELGTSSPEKTMKAFLDLVKQNNQEQSQTLISSKADAQSFENVFGESESSSLYGKDFTYQIHNIQTEAPGTISYVSVEIVKNGQSQAHLFTLLKDRGTGVWQLVKNEVFAPVSSEP